MGKKNQNKTKKNSGKFPLIITKYLPFFKKLIDTLWFFPSIIVIVFVFLAIVGIYLDVQFGPKAFQEMPYIFGAQAEGSRGMLSAIASSMITVLGVSFSITIVTLSLASNQYTPRILRNFMKDRINQSVMGVFAGIFIYCLLVLRTIRGSEEGFIPAISVAFSVILAIVGIAFLILFIHHISSSIQASNMIASLAEETVEAIDHLFPNDINEDENINLLEKNKHLNKALWTPILASKSGYLQRISFKILNSYCKKRNLYIKIDYFIGDFIVEGMPIIHVSGNDVDVTEIEKKLKTYISIGQFRTIDQDPSYGIRIIVDIALKALSPGINDTTTAMNCIDYLSTIMFKLGSRSLKNNYYIEDDEVRIINDPRSFEDLVILATQQIRINSQGKLDVLLTLLKMIETMGKSKMNADRRKVLHKEFNFISETAAINLTNSYEQKIFQARKMELFNQGVFNLVVDDAR